MRLNRYLALSGLGSRRSVEELILQGRVKVNGAVTRDLATQVDEENDRVEVDEELARAHPEKTYLALNKPEGYDVTRRDPHAKRTVFDLLSPKLDPSVQAVGRLDRPTTGLLLLTNDGELSFRLSHPRYKVEKEYEVFGPKPPERGQIERLIKGVQLEDGFARAARAELIQGGGGPRAKFRFRPGLRIVTHLGRNRIVRRMCEAVAFEISSLNRTRIGPVKLAGLAVGKSRLLGKDEVRELRKAVGLEAQD
jgi:23S rRNA pseudouridine2605 synthase